MEEVTNIKNMIYEIRGVRVMFDSDLAKLYGVEPKRINEAVNRNREKFPNRFSFVINTDELRELEVAIYDLKKGHGGRRYNYRVFTEQGTAMLATILKSKTATQVSIQIMDAFDTYHDRYFILDKEIIYHSGTSINNAGSKTFSINKLEDQQVVSLLISKILERINKNE